MRKLIKWQFREYRNTVMQVMLGLLVVAAGAAWLSHVLFDLSAELVVAVFQTVQWGALGGAIMVHYLPHITMYQAVRDSHTLPLHVPLPLRWALFAKIIAILPLLFGYIATDTFLFAVMGTDLPQMPELSPDRSLARAALFILITSLLMNGLVLRTLQRHLLFLPARGRVLARLQKWSTRLNIVFDLVLLLAYSSAAGIFIAAAASIGISPYVEALIFSVGGLGLTYVNGYLLERYTPQLEAF
jgi:hypothetical protein